MSNPAYLLDANVLIALTHPEHVHFQAVTEWFNTPVLDWGICAFSEAGFLRVTSNPNAGGLTIGDATSQISVLSKQSGYRFWPINSGWASLTAPFKMRIHGHQQITDAYLLGLAIKENGILVTLDRAMKSMAGPQYSKHVLVLS